MKILVDIGNTRLKYLLEQENEETIRGSIDNSNVTNEWLTEHWDIASHIIIGSVNTGDLIQLINTWAKTNRIKIQLIESEKSRFGITSSYDEPKSLGVDRWLAFLGAASIFPKKSVVIIDAGTATTLDVMDSKGEHQGGWILSGVDLLLSQLNQNTAKVLFKKTDTVNVEWGKSTSECVNNAAWAATIAMLNKGIQQAEQKFTLTHCIILGGNAERLLPFIRSENAQIEIMHDLIFEGLKCYSME